MATLCTHTEMYIHKKKGEEKTKRKKEKKKKTQKKREKEIKHHTSDNGSFVTPR